MASIFDTIRKTYQKAKENFSGNVQALSNPQTRSQWFRGFTPAVQNYANTYSKVAPYIPFAPQIPSIQSSQQAASRQQQVLRSMMGNNNYNTLSQNANLVRTNPQFARALPSMVGQGVSDLTKEFSNRYLPQSYRTPFNTLGGYVGNLEKNLTNVITMPYANKPIRQNINEGLEAAGQIAMPGKTLGFAALGTGFQQVAPTVMWILGKGPKPTVEGIKKEFARELPESGKSAVIYEAAGKVLQGPFDKIFGPTLKDANQFIDQGFRYGGPVLKNPYFRTVAKKITLDLLRSGQELGIPQGILGFLNSQKAKMEDKIVEGLGQYGQGTAMGTVFRAGQFGLQIIPHQFLNRVVKPLIQNIKEAQMGKEGQAGFISLNGKENNVNYLSKQFKNSLENKPDEKPGAIDRAIKEIKEGKKPPVRVRQTPEGEWVIEDGRHHLEAARRLGLVDYPIEDVTSKYGQPQGVIPKEGGVSGQKAILPTQESTLLEKTGSQKGAPRIEKPLKTGKPPSQPPQNISSEGSITNPSDPFYNINRLKITDEAKTKIKEKITGEFKPTFESATGKTLSHEEIIDAAKSTSDDIIQTIGRQRTEQLGAAQLRLRQSIAQMINEGKVDEELLTKLKADKSLSTSTARLLGQRAISAEPNSPNGKLLQKMLGNILDVNDDIDSILAKAKGVDFNNPQESASFYREFIKPSAGDWIDKLRYNSMLTSPNTHIINVTSNYQGTGFITPIQKTIEGGIDSIVSTLTGRPRTRFAGEGAAYAGGYYGAVKQAYKNFMNVMSGRQFGEHPDLYNVPLSTGGTSGFVEKALDIGGRFLEAEDQFFKTLTSSGLESAYNYRSGQGVAVDQLKQKAQQEAQELLFRGDFTKEGAGVISNLLGSFGQSVKNLTYSDNAAQRWIAKLTFPFVKIGTNLAKTGFEFNPISGSLNMIGNSDKTAQLAKILIGSGITAMAVPFALDDRLTFDLPTTTSKRGQLARAANIPRYSIKLGNTWVSYTKMHPAIAWQLATVAALTDAWKDKRLTEGGASALMNGVFSAMKFGLDQTYYKNVSDFMQGVNGDFERFSAIPSNYFSQFIPFRAFASWLNRAIDKVQRAPDTKADFFTQSLQQVMSQLPGLSKLVPPRLDMQGQPMERQNQFLNMISPYQTAPEKEPYGSQYRELTNVTREIAPIKAESAKLKNQVESIWTELQPLSNDGMRMKVKQYLRDGTLTPEQFKSIIWPKIKEKIQMEKTGGYTPAEETVKGLSAPDEAKYYYGKLSTMGRAEWKAYLADLYKRKVLTKDTFKEIIKLDMQTK